MDPIARVLLARFRLAISRRPELLAREPWYAAEGRRVREMARAAGVDEGRAILAAAALSPATKWEGLMARLPAFLADSLTPGPWYPRNARTAAACLRGELAALRGPKVSRFARNLAGDPSCVTVDRWAARAAGLPESGGARWYRAIEGAYLEAAAAARMAPSAFQAVVWIAVREGVVELSHAPR